MPPGSDEGEAGGDLRAVVADEPVGAVSEGLRVRDLEGGARED